MIERSLGDAVALARAFLHFCSVENRNSAACVMDEAGPFERVGRIGYTRPTHSEHHGKKFLGEREIARLHTILSHQEPATTPLFEQMKGVAGDRLRDLVEERVRIMEHCLWYTSVPLHLPSEKIRSHFQAGTPNLHVGTRGRVLVTK